jgi:hypothetical protein
MAGPEVRIRAPTKNMKTIKPTQAHLFAFIGHLLSAAEPQQKSILIGLSPFPSLPERGRGRGEKRAMSHKLGNLYAKWRKIILLKFNNLFLFDIVKF